MKLTSLGLDAPAPVTTPRPSAVSVSCPTCGAGKDKRIEGGGFGPKKLTLCGYCGYEFPAA